jgi:hypothetical protein
VSDAFALHLSVPDGDANDVVMNMAKNVGDGCTIGGSVTNPNTPTNVSVTPASSGDCTITISTSNGIYDVSASTIKVIHYPAFGISAAWPVADLKMKINTTSSEIYAVEVSGKIPPTHPVTVVLIVNSGSCALGSVLLTFSNTANFVAGQPVLQGSNSGIVEVSASSSTTVLVKITSGSFSSGAQLTIDGTAMTPSAAKPAKVIVFKAGSMSPVPITVKASGSAEACVIQSA